MGGGTWVGVWVGVHDWVGVFRLWALVQECAYTWCIGLLVPVCGWMSCLPALYALTRSDVCRDRLNCRKAHSEDEFVEWGNRYQHRRRKTAGEQNPLSIVPQGEGVVLPANVSGLLLTLDVLFCSLFFLLTLVLQGDSEYGMKLMLSGQPLDVSVQSGKEFSWQITLEGQVCIVCWSCMLCRHVVRGVFDPDIWSGVCLILTYGQGCF